MLVFAKRGFYFQSLSPAQRNTDFPLNLGYNVHYKHFAQYQTKDKSWFTDSIRLKNLKRQFSEHYFDLLRAIESRDFQKLTALCEENLTQAIAAATYEQTKVLGNTFKVVKPAETKCEVDIVNHFYIFGVNLSRERNANMLLRHYNLIHTKQGNLHYALKSESGTRQDIDLMRESSDLDNYLRLKKMYQLSENQPVKEDSSGVDMLLLVQRFEQNQYLRKTVKAKLVEELGKEYALIAKLKKHLITF